MKSANMKQKLSIRLAIVCLLTFLLPSLCSAGPKKSATMEEMLTSLDYDYVSASKDFFAIQCGNRRIYITKKPKRNPATNVVKHTIFTFWQPIFLEKDLEKQVLALTKDPAKGKYFTESVGPRKRICFGFLSVPKDVSETDLNNMITQCAKAQFPVSVNQQLQYKRSIEEFFIKLPDVWKEGRNYAEIAIGMSKIDISYCPADFQQAVRNLIQAMVPQCKVETNRSNEIIIKTSDDVLIEGILDGLFSIAETALQQQAIQNASNQVLQVARKYGVEVD